ncbi:hypothetical protein ACXYFN_01925 [Mycoplasma sp. 48589B]
MKKLRWLLPLGILPLAALPVVATACSTTNKLKKREHIMQGIKDELAKYGVNFSKEQEDAYKNFDQAAYDKLSSQLQANASKIFALNKEINEVEMAPEQKEAKQAQLDALLKQQGDLLSKNILPYFAYLYNFTTKFYDYGLLTKALKSDTHAVHTPLYVHYAANVQNENSNDIAAPHTHFTYNRNEVKPNVLMKKLKYSRLQESPKYPGYRVMYVSFKRTVFKIYVSAQGQVTLDPLCIYFTKSSDAYPIDPTDTFDAMEKNEATLTKEDIILFETKFAKRYDVQYPQFNLIY